MKHKSLLKTFLVAILAICTTMGFTSCSEEENATTSQVRQESKSSKKTLLPSVIHVSKTPSSAWAPLASSSIINLWYDDSKRIVRMKETVSNGTYDGFVYENHYQYLGNEQYPSKRTYTYYLDGDPNGETSIEFEYSCENNVVTQTSSDLASVPRYVDIYLHSNTAAYKATQRWSNNAKDKCTMEWERSATGNTDKQVLANGNGYASEGACMKYDDKKGIFSNCQTSAWVLSSFLLGERSLPGTSRNFDLYFENNLIHNASDDINWFDDTSTYLYNDEGYPIKQHLIGLRAGEPWDECEVIIEYI